MADQRVSTDQIRANAAPVTPHSNLEEQLERRAEWGKLFTTSEERPQSEDVTKFYPPVTEADKPVSEEVRGYLRMREAKLMEELWSKEKALAAKVREYQGHRSAERNSVSLQIGRGVERRPEVSSEWCTQEAERRGLTLQPPPTMGLLKELLSMGQRSELEHAPKQQLVDELSELRDLTPDQILAFLHSNKLHSYANNPKINEYLNQQRVSDRQRPELAAGPHGHSSEVPLLLDEARAGSLLKGLQESGASAHKQVEILRELPIPHSLKAQYINQLDLPSTVRVELLQQLPPSWEREYELLKELPVGPMSKMQFVQQLPVHSDRKCAMLHDMGLPPPDSELLAGLKQLAAECPGGLEEALGCFPGSAEEKQAVEAELEVQALASSIAGAQPAESAASKLDTLHEMKLLVEERRALNQRLGNPVELEPAKC